MCVCERERERERERDSERKREKERERERKRAASVLLVRVLKGDPNKRCLAETLAHAFKLGHCCKTLPHPFLLTPPPTHTHTHTCTCTNNCATHIDAHGLFS